MTTADVELGRLIVGCGTFGGIGGSSALIGKGLDEVGAYATLDEAVALGLTMLDSRSRPRHSPSNSRSPSSTN